ncbi:MAG: hypothetical protein OSA99_11370 [Acidimicrobiales bacterium]|nr:hypothetical protein [Acidimicrobiales bacterium]
MAPRAGCRIGTVLLGRQDAKYPAVGVARREMAGFALGHHDLVTTESKGGQLPRWMVLAPFAVAGFGLIAGASWGRVARDFVVTSLIIGTVALLLARRSARAAEMPRQLGFGLFLAIVCTGVLALRGAEISYPKTPIVLLVAVLGTAIAGFVLTRLSSGYATRGSKQVKYLRPFLPRRRND